MNGTEKQVNWAEDIKAKYVQTMSGWVDETRQMTEKHRPDQLWLVPILEEKVQAHLAEVCANDDAKFWIDNYGSFDKWAAREELKPIFAEIAQEHNQ